MSNNDLEIAAEVIKRPASEWLTEQYLPYSLYVIRDRALVSEDGLKPVNRRILYSLFKNGFHPSAKHLKASRAAADAVAFHPHGNSSIEDALAHMAQDFKMRVPLIDAAGSVGKVTGDRAAAARYWDCRLSKPAMELLKELSMGALPFGKNFDGELDEPRLLPVRWPNNIINGTEGIAVGYASQMFAHNPGETMKAAIALLRNDELTTAELLKIMPGPDLPTGGELLEVEGVKEYYETGSGRFAIRGRYTVENLTRGRVRILFYELPFQVSPEKIIAKVQDLQNNGQLKDIATIKDLSDRINGLRLAVDTKVGSNHLSVLNELFKMTPIEQRFSVNNTILIDNTPVKTSMIDMLRGFLALRKTCVLNKAKSRQEKIDQRIYQLSAILAALVDIDKCIKIIRGAETSDDAKSGLMKAFSIEEEQAEYILSIQLRRLTKADSVALNKEIADLKAEHQLNQDILTDPARLDDVIESELRETMEIIKDKRRTVISGLTKEDIKETQQAFVKAAKESTKSLPCYITRFADGTILRSAEPFSYERIARKFEHSPIVEQIKTMTKEHFLVVTSDGMGYRVPVSYLTNDIGVDLQTAGIHVADNAKLVAIGRYKADKEDVGVVLATKLGDVKVTKIEFPNKDEFKLFSVAEGDEIVNGFWVNKSLENTNFVSVSAHGNILAYDAAKVRPTGVGAGGMKSQKMIDESDAVVGFSWVDNPSETPLFVVSQGNLTLKLTPLSEIPPKGRGAQGVALHKFKKNETKLLHAAVATSPVIAVSGMNNAISSPPISKRATTGVDFTIDTVIGNSTVVSK